MVGKIIAWIVTAVLVTAVVFYALAYKAFVLDAVTWAPSAHAHTHDWAQLTPEQQKWFGSQRNPTTGDSCCSIADGAWAEEDIRDGEYWVRCNDERSHCPIKEWMRVPPEVVIHDPNRNGAPVVWWRGDWGADGKQIIVIRCYAPGGGV